MSTRFVGAKSGSGVYQTIINAMPPHDVYIEAFAGTGAILRRKKRCYQSVAIDRDAVRITQLKLDVPYVDTFVGDCRDLLPNIIQSVPCHLNTLVYCDPPYVKSTRRSDSNYYKFELTDAEHADLITLLISLGSQVMVMVSGYRNKIYDDMLDGWRRIDFKAMTRKGPAIESLWMNFPDNGDRHEFTFAGSNYRERERISRKTKRWIKKLETMQDVDRRAIIDAIREGGYL